MDITNKRAMPDVLQLKKNYMIDVNKEKLVTVFAGTVWQAELTKGLLDANGVPCAIMDETIGAVTSSYAGIESDVLVVVPEEEKERALEVIKQNREK